ncbi:3395_t:CDS:2, partial [Acaulospora morrowiae]
MSLYQIKSEALKPFRDLQNHQLHASNSKIGSKSSFSILPSTAVFLLIQGGLTLLLQYFTVELIFLLPRYQFSLFGLVCGFYMQVNMEVGNRFLIFFSTLCLCGGEYNKDEWHLLFNEPWKSTSLTDFWSKRWHQIFREIWVSLAYRPLRSLMRNKFGPSLGVFVLSGIMHEYVIWTALYPFWTPGEQFLFFMLQAAGVILEKLLGQSKLIPHNMILSCLGWFWTFGFLYFTIPYFLNPYIKGKP